MIIVLALFLISFGIVALGRSKSIRWKVGQWRPSSASRLPKVQRKSATFSSQLGKTQGTEKEYQYVFPPLQPKTSPRTSMGLKRLEKSNWLTIDSYYTSEHRIRNHLLKTSRQNVIQCLPGSEAACHEVLSIAVNFLTTRFSDHFTVEGQTVHNNIANESFVIGSACPNPLEVAARLAMEDFNVLMKNPETSEYHLQASATLFPAGWKLQERIGTTMANLHGPVPGWKQNIGGSVNRYVSRVSAFTTWLTLHNQGISTTCPPKQQWSAQTSSSSAPRISFLMLQRPRQTVKAWLRRRSSLNISR